jgi:hypothetical protein
MSQTVLSIIRFVTILEKCIKIRDMCECDVCTTSDFDAIFVLVI